jgi:hypothetical protein
MKYEKSCINLRIYTSCRAFKITAMKQMIYILIIAIGPLSCNNQPKQIDKTTIAETDNQIRKVDNSKY